MDGWGYSVITLPKLDFDGILNKPRKKNQPAPQVPCHYLYIMVKKGGMFDSPRNPNMMLSPPIQTDEISKVVF